MTNKFLTLTLLIIANIAIGRSQVTIGNTEKPIDGSLLQLKDIDKVTDGSKNANKGIMLPRVQLTTPTELYPMFDLGDVNYTTVQKEIHTGLLVYVPERWNSNNYDPGIYVWNGIIWKPLAEKY